MFGDFGFDTLCAASTPPVSERERPGGPIMYRKVSFSSQVEVEEIPNVETLTKRQRKALWHPEPKRTTKVGKGLQQLMCFQILPSGDGDQLVVDERQDKTMPSHLPISAVLSEQESQRDYGLRGDPAAIAKVYRRCSAYSKVRAQMRALEFELDAQEYQSEAPKQGSRIARSWQTNREGII